MLKTRSGRSFAGALVFTASLDLALAYGISIMADSDQWFFFLAALLVLWVGPILFGVKSVIYKTVLHFLNRKVARQLLVHEFRKVELPLLSGTDFNDPADLYFADVAQDDRLPKPARLFSSQTLGQMGIVPLYSSADAIILNANLDAALAIYFDELRRDGVKPVQ